MRLLALTALLGLAVTGPANAIEPLRDTAYCVYGSTTVSTNTPQQMSTNYGSGVCVLSSGSNARRFLENNYGGTGKKCSC